MITRRQAIKTTTLATLTAVAAPQLLGQTAAAPKPIGPFSLPALPYAFDALEPSIDARTMEIHHDRHHAGYVANLNKAVTGLNLGDHTTLEDLLRNLDSIPEPTRTAIRNNGGGHFNHSLFWQVMKKGGSEPKAELAKALETNFGSYNEFQTQFATAATKVFGSGWAWLVWQKGKLLIQAAPNQDTPWSEGRVPLLGLDVWEHAYYLKYQNKRADYIAAWWKVVNWDFVTEQYQKAQG